MKKSSNLLVFICIIFIQSLYFQVNASDRDNFGTFTKQLMKLNLVKIDANKCTSVERKLGKLLIPYLQSGNGQTIDKGFIDLSRQIGLTHAF